MKLYELVISLDPSLSTEQSNELTSKIEALFGNWVKQKDEIGYQTVYNVRGIKKGGQAYFISYLLEIDPTALPEIKQKMSLFKGLLRSLFLLTSTKSPFVIFKDINEKYSEKLIELATKDKKAKKTRDQKQQLLDTTNVEIEVTEWIDESTEEDKNE